MVAIAEGRLNVAVVVRAAQSALWRSSDHQPLTSGRNCVAIGRFEARQSALSFAPESCYGLSHWEGQAGISWQGTSGLGVRRAWLAPHESGFALPGASGP